MLVTHAVAVGLNVFFDTFKADIAERHVDTDTKDHSKFWSAVSLMVSDRSRWKSIVNMGNDGMGSRSS